MKNYFKIPFFLKNKKLRKRRKDVFDQKISLGNLLHEQNTTGKRLNYFYDFSFR